MADTCLMLECHPPELHTLTCEQLYNCCDCGGHDCGCRYCWSCNACEVCNPPEGARDD